ncbi:response regulator transcription factor [Paenibacillus illinoisensis]|uniref:response regulator transcription factor n=1 Tax=Paenibacillus illinoisensis TaxID=59845 RepID=UPI003019BFC7
MFKVIVAEDDDVIRQAYSKILVKNGYHVLEASNGEQVLSLLEHTNVDIIISDIMMPRIDGYELLTTLREFGYIMPVLMITAKDDFVDLQKGFRLGADDYMVKPININEMLVRVQALLRRSQMISDRKFSIGGTTFEYDSYMVYTAEDSQILPQKEFLLLYYLVCNCGRSFTRLQILDEVWGYNAQVESHTVDVHINRLRKRFANNPDFEIITIRGMGYKAVKRNG